MAYGLFPALMQSRQQVLSEEQRAEDNARRQEEMAMRQRQMAMQEESHRAQMEATGLQLRQQRGVADAQSQVTGLAKREQDNAQFQASGLPGPVMPVMDRDWSRAQLGLAAAKGDARGMVDARQQSKMLDVDEEAKRLSADPAFQSRVMDFITTKDMFPLKVVPGQRDPKTGRMKTADRLEFDSGYAYELKQGDKQRLAYGAALMNKGMNKEGLEIIGAVNKELAASIDMANRRTVSASDFNSKADDRLADNELRAEQIATQRAMRSAAGASRNPDVDPKLLAEYNDMVASYQQAVDSGDAKRAKELRSQLVVKQAQMSTAMKRPMSLRDETQPRPERTVSPKDVVDLALKLQDRDSKLSPAGAMMQAKAMLEGQDPMAAAKASFRDILGAGSGAPAGGAPAGQAPGETGLRPPRAQQKPAVTFETMPLELLRGYAGTSPEARAIYMRRVEEQQRLAQQPRFWVNPAGAPSGQEAGFDRGY